jgi:hypothetical protein
MTLTFSDRIDNRWLTRWHSICILEAHRHLVAPREFIALCIGEHSRRLRLCLAAGLSWPAITRHDLDDPRPPEPSFTQSLAAARERKRTRLSSQQQAVVRRSQSAALRSPKFNVTRIIE